MAGSGDRHSDLEKLVAESVAKSLPAVLQGVYEPKVNVDTVTKSTDETPVPTTSPGDPLYNTE